MLTQQLVNILLEVSMKIYVINTLPYHCYLNLILMSEWWEARICFGNITLTICEDHDQNSYYFSQIIHMVNMLLDLIITHTQLKVKVRFNNIDSIIYEYMNMHRKHQNLYHNYKLLY